MKKSVMNLVDKCNRHYRRMRAKNPGLLPLIPGCGRVIGNGSKVELTVENGATLVYRVTHRTEFVVTFERLKAAAVRPAATLADIREMRSQYDASFADLERRMQAAEAAESNPPHSNVVTIAAE